METTGHRIRKMRRSKAVSQKELAKTVGVSQASITYWESDTNEPAGANLLALASALGVTPDWLISGRGGPAAQRGLFHALILPFSPSAATAPLCAIRTTYNFPCISCCLQR